MNGALVESLPATEPADVYELVRQLRREVLDLRREVNELRRENAELRQQAGYWKGMHARAVQRCQATLKLGSPALLMTKPPS